MEKNGIDNSERNLFNDLKSIKLLSNELVSKLLYVSIMYVNVYCIILIYHYIIIFTLICHLEFCFFQHLQEELEEAANVRIFFQKFFVKKKRILLLKKRSQ